MRGGRQGVLERCEEEEAGMTSMPRQPFFVSYLRVARRYCSAYNDPSMLPKYTIPRSTTGEDMIAPIEINL